MELYYGGALYITGLILLLMPPDEIFWFDGDREIVRVVKHAIGLITFAAGVISIHREIYQDAGQSFLVVSCLLILVIALFRIWQEKSV